MEFASLEITPHIQSLNSWFSAMPLRPEGQYIPGALFGECAFEGIAACSGYTCSGLWKLHAFERMSGCVPVVPQDLMRPHPHSPGRVTPYNPRPLLQLAFRWPLMLLFLRPAWGPGWPLP